MSPCLLVVDDDAALNLALCAHFEDRGWRATGVYDCAAAVAATAGAAFEVVLLDVQLPDGDGVELLVRLLERDPHLPVILMTGGRDVERAMQAIAAGAFDWLPKPFEPAEMERLVDRAQAARQATVAGAAETDDAPLRTLVGESRALLEYLYTFAEQPHFTCRRRWSEGDIGVWDNRCTQHYAVNDAVGERVIHRVTILGHHPEPAFDTDRWPAHQPHGMSAAVATERATH